MYLRKRKQYISYWVCKYMHIGYCSLYVYARKFRTLALKCMHVRCSYITAEVDLFHSSRRHFCVIRFVAREPFQLIELLYMDNVILHARVHWKWPKGQKLLETMVTEITHKLRSSDLQYLVWGKQPSVNIE